MKFRYTKEFESPVALRVQSSANKIDDVEFLSYRNTGLQNAIF